MFAFNSWLITTFLASHHISSIVYSLWNWIYLHTYYYNLVLFFSSSLYSKTSSSSSFILFLIYSFMHLNRQVNNINKIVFPFGAVDNPYGSYLTNDVTKQIYGLPQRGMYIGNDRCRCVLVCLNWPYPVPSINFCHFRFLKFSIRLVLCMCVC